ncbi:MAG: transposase [Muribaculaceae bacterium]|nr:transposase [Muribaculaceae bacterium]
MTLRQRKFILEQFPEIFKTKSKADIFEILNALFFLIKTGCQWKSIDVVCKYPTIRMLKADNGYRGPLVKNLMEGLNVALECVKSNFGTSEFKPINGRWVVERTFSWLGSFRRLNRNYEQFLHTARGIAMAACAMFMLRFV